ncbi:MAG: HD domain-containing protein [Oscillospiraceae bacterium]
MAGERAMNIPEQAKKAVEMLQDNGYKAYLVGGCVRDFLMNKQPADIDITTDALPMQMMEIFSEYKIIPTGLKHGTVTVVIDLLPLEITTFRVDGIYTDNRHPSSVHFTRSLHEDLSRRDFTINAIAYNEIDGIIDYFDGESDIKNKIIRCVGESDKRFKEDALRILRGLRFAAVLGFAIEDKTSKSMLQNKELIKNISVERAATEIMKLLLGQGVKDVIINYTEVIAVVIPELLPMKGFKQSTPYHIYDILTHSAVAVENVPPEPCLRLAALLHDIGKPQTFSMGKDGTSHFYGHAAVSEKLSSNILNRLKLDNVTKQRVLTLIKYHDVQIEADRKSVKKWLAKLSVEVFFQLIQLKRADNFAQNPQYFYRQKQLDEIVTIANEIIYEGECFTLKDLAVNGSDLIAIGIPKGKEVGITLKQLLVLVMENKIENKKESLLQYLQNRL